jgi:hypothetical protein
MWDKPEHLTLVALARPLRIAYLVDVDDRPDCASASVSDPTAQPSAPIRGLLSTDGTIDG